MLNEGQQMQYDQTGLLRLPGAIQVGDAAGMLSRLWEFLGSEHGIFQDRPETWPTGSIRRLQAATRSGMFNSMASTVVRGALNDILGEEARLPGVTAWWGRPLVTFHSSRSWAVPTAGWHLDASGNERPGVTVFACLAPVAERGGGTLIVEGSHRLVDRYIQATGVASSAKVKAALAGLHPWLRDLWAGRPDPHRVAAYLRHGASVGGQQLVVRELTGKAGDVVLMNAQCLHAPAANALTRPRIMLVEQVRLPWRAPT